MKKLLLSILFLAFIGFAFAEKVGINEARQVAQHAYYESLNYYWENVALDDVNIENQYIFNSNGEEVYYIFNMENYGFIIIAAEDAMVPVLGYGFTKQYDPENVPTNFAGWMNGRIDAIEYIRENNMEATQEVENLWDSYTQVPLVEGSRDEVGPLCLSTWDQGWPYNYFCPEDNGGSGGHVWAGCVATSMAQVMYYWRHPWVGEGQHTYYHPDYGYQTAVFEDAFYDYNGMLDNLGSEVNVPIALLQYHCGVAVNMDYGPDGSGANMTNARSAMVNYFNFKSQAQRVQRQGYQLEVWKNMCRGDLDLGRVIMYAGFDNSGGHCWELDGYNDSDLFHFNFGWGGYADGWYDITNPQGYTDSQEMVYRLEPEDTDYPTYCSDLTISAYDGIIEDGSGPIEDYQNNAGCSWLLDITDAGFPPASSIAFDFLAVDTEVGNDVVTIYDGDNNNAPVLVQASGSDVPTGIESTTGTVLVEFTTNGSNAGSGWRLAYEVDVACPSQDPYEFRNWTFDDGSGEYDYYLNKNCNYFIEPTGASYVEIEFTSFETEENDVLQIYDGVTYQLLGEFSGDLDPLPDPITCNHGKVWILFDTDPVGSAPGWTLTYDSDGTVSGMDEKEIVSDFELYPNPVTDMVNVSFLTESRQDIEISIYNTQGQAVYMEQVEHFIGNYNGSIDVSDLSKGIYFVSFKGENGFINEKLIIQ